MEYENVKIIILAAGHGKRMKSELPKVLIPLHGKPLISHILDSVKKTNISNKPIVVVGQKRELVMKTLGDSCEYIIQEEQKGTGHAVMMAQQALKDNTDHVVVLYGDHPFVSSKTIQKLIEKHLSTGAKITMATVKLSDFNDWRNIFYNNFSRIIRDKDGYIVKDVQIKDASEEDKKITEINPCYLCFEAKWLWENLKTLDTNNAQKEYYLTDLVKIAIKEKAKIESITIDPHEALGVNSQEELKILEKLTI